MNTSRQAVIDTLQCCETIYHNLFNEVDYSLTRDELKCIHNFRQLWQDDFPEEAIFDEAGIGIDAVGFLVGYITLPHLRINILTGKDYTQNN